jgi:hypothetical protein
MATISIIDTGYLRTDVVSGTQAPVIVNSSTAITLNVESLTYESGSNVDTAPLVNSSSNGVVGMGSVNNPKIVIKGVLNRASAADIGNMIFLERMRRTYGVKLLYYNDAASTYYNILNQMGAANQNDVHKAANFSNVTTPHLHVKVIGFSTEDLPRSFVRYTLTMVETA